MPSRVCSKLKHILTSAKREQQKAEQVDGITKERISRLNEIIANA